MAPAAQAGHLSSHLPRTSTSNESEPAMIVPTRVAKTPDRMCGMTCMPKAASASSRAPELKLENVSKPRKSQNKPQR